MKIELNKKYKTRDGRPVRIFCVDMNASYPVAGCIMNKNGTEELCSWTADGKFTMGIKSIDKEVGLFQPNDLMEEE
jgi:hypothetical protein